MSSDRLFRKNSSASKRDEIEESSISKSASSKRNPPLIRSFRAKSSSSTTTGSQKRKSVEVQEALLEIKEIADESESKDGLTPITLARWIISKGESHGSVYLLPFEGQEEENSQLGYRYRISGTTQPLNEKQFYTLSSTGLTSFHFGDVRFLTLDQWVAEFRNYERLCTIPFFFRFKKTKSFQTWKRIVKRQKFVSATKKLSESSCIFGNPKMRHCFLQVQSLVGKLTDMVSKPFTIFTLTLTDCISSMALFNLVKTCKSSKISKDSSLSQVILKVKDLKGKNYEIDEANDYAAASDAIKEVCG